MNFRESQKESRGAVLILLVISLTALLGLVALAIDVSIYFSQHSKLERTAEQAALAALEKYLDILSTSTDPDPNQDALNHALVRAEDITGLNLESHITAHIRKNPTSSLSDLQHNADGANGTFSAGTWYFDWPDSATPACDGGNPNPFKPCFETLPIGSDRRANAIKVTLHPNQASPLSHIFGRVFKSEKKEFDLPTVSATASLVPRRGVFLIDLSRSIVRDTHEREGDTDGSDAEYAYYVDPDQLGACDPDNAWKSSLHPADQDTFDYMLPDDRHLQFTCFDIGGGVDESFGVDMTIPPQPLTGVLDAIHTAFDIFRERAVPSDKVGLIGFDDELLDQRKMPLTEAFSATNETFNNFLIATDTSEPFSSRKDYFLFPRYYGGNFSGGGNRMPAMTDIRLALGEARNMLHAEDFFAHADNFIVLISDGMSNCTMNPPGPYSCYFSNSSPATIGLSEAYIEQSLLELSMEADELRRANIRLHVFLIGDHVAPHSLLRGGSNGCMTDLEAQYHGDPPGSDPLDFVDPSGGTLDSTDDTPYFHPNRLYDYVEYVGGLWNPIVDCCRDAGGNCLPDVSPELENACNAVADGALVTCCATAGAPCQQICNWVDNQGRLLCDPFNRPKTQQVIDAIERIMKNNPFILVD